MCASYHNRCDVHVIVSDKYAKYHQQCFASLEAEPVNVHRIPGTPGHIGLGRYEGFHTGNAEFVSFVDDDDFVLPRIFDKCYKALDDDPTAIGVCTREATLTGDVFHPGYEIDPNEHWVHLFKVIHHLTVYRREMIMPYVDLYKDCDMGGEVFMHLKMLSDGHHFTFVPEIGYVWRIHGEGASSNRPMTPKYKEESARILEQAQKQRRQT